MLTRWAPAWSVVAGGLLVTAVLVLVVPRVADEPPVGDAPGDSRTAAGTAPSLRSPVSPTVASGTADEPSTAPDLAVVADLLARRDAALAERDPALLAATSVPHSPVAVQDAELLARLTAAGTVVDGLRIEATDLRTVTTEEGTAVVEVLISQGAHQRVTGEERVTVGAQPATCARLDLATDGHGWLLAGSEPCS